MFDEGDEEKDDCEKSDPPVAPPEALFVEALWPNIDGVAADCVVGCEEKMFPVGDAKFAEPKMLGDVGAFEEPKTLED